MGRVRYRQCVQCQREGTDARPISSRGLCDECGLANWAQSLAQINNREGPVYNKYLRKTTLGTLRYLESLNMPQLSEGDTAQLPPGD